MNRIGMLLGQLHGSQTHLARRFRHVAQRESVEQDVYYMCHQLADQCETHAEAIRDLADDRGTDLDAPGDASAIGQLIGTIESKAAEALGRRPEPGLLLLRDLRHLFLMAQEVNVHWIALGQVAQATRDAEMLETVTTLHKQTLTQIKWIKTRLKAATPQIMIVAT